MTARHPYDCHVRLTADEYRELQRLADAGQRSLTGQVRFMLSRRLDPTARVSISTAATKEG